MSNDFKPSVKPLDAPKYKILTQIGRSLHFDDFEKNARQDMLVPTFEKKNNFLDQV